MTKPKSPTQRANAARIANKRALIPRVVAMHKAGHGIGKIAAAVHRSRATIVRYLREHGETPCPGTEDGSWFQTPKFVELRDDEGRAVYRGNVGIWSESTPRKLGRGVVCEPLPILEWGR